MYTYKYLYQVQYPQLLWWSTLVQVLRGTDLYLVLRTYLNVYHTAVLVLAQWQTIPPLGLYCTSTPRKCGSRYDIAHTQHTAHSPDLYYHRMLWKMLLQITCSTDTDPECEAIQKVKEPETTWKKYLKMFKLAIRHKQKNSKVYTVRGHNSLKYRLNYIILKDQNF